MRSKGIAATSYRRCAAADCPRCAPDYIVNHILRALNEWRDQPIYRAVFTTDADYKNSRRSRDIRDNYKGRFLTVVQGYLGERVMFYPGTDGAGDLVPADELLDTLLDAFCRAPANAAMKRRVTNVKPTAQPRDGDEPTDPDEPREKVTVQLPLHVSVYELRVIFPDARYPEGYRPKAYFNGGGDFGGESRQVVDGRELACALIEHTLGRKIDWSQMPYSRKRHSHSWVVRGLTPAEIDAVRTALAPLHEIFIYERTARKRANAARKANAIRDQLGEETPW